MQAENERDPTSERVDAQVCVVGGGPAGMFLAFLLARAGIEVVVLEKHADFLRDFRGDTIHPSTLQLLYELGLLDEFLKRPHQQARELHGIIGDDEVPVADFTHLPTRCKFIAFMPQWDFLDFLAEHGRRYPTFHARMLAEATDLIEERDGRIVGVRATTPEGPLEVHAPLTIGADGRGSIVRARAGLVVRDIGAPMDVLWLRLPRRQTDPEIPLGRFGSGRILALIYRGEFWQCGYVIPKGTLDEIKRRGLEAFQRELAELAPFLADRVGLLQSWDDIKLLTVKVDRLERWHRPGLLCIGDAAHAMSPVGGVGINLAIQDAVATANILARPLLEKRVVEEDLARVERRRTMPTRLTQRLQVLIQNNVIRRTLAAHHELKTPLLLRLLKRFPLLRRIPARVIGIGFRPEHVRTADAFAGQAKPAATAAGS